MNFKFLLFVIATVSIASCSTAYKSGQTPDDVYYSPVRGIDEKDNREDEEDRSDNYEEREIRMATRDRRWRDINDDYDYRYDPYRYGYNYGYYYNPYYYNRPVYIPGCTIINPKNTTPRMTNLGSYNNNTLVVSDPKSGQTKWVKSTRSYNNSNNNGSFVRRILTPSSTNSSAGSGRSRSTSNNDNNDNNTRTYSPSSSSSRSSSSGSTSSGSSSGGKSVSRPTRGN
jgi:hypothetical protein